MNLTQTEVIKKVMIGWLRKGLLVGPKVEAMPRAICEEHFRRCLTSPLTSLILLESSSIAMAYFITYEEDAQDNILSQLFLYLLLMSPTTCYVFPL